MCHPVGDTTRAHPRVPLDRYKPHTHIPHMRELATGKHVWYEPDKLDAADQGDGGAGEVSPVPHVDFDLGDCRRRRGGAVVRSEPRVVRGSKAGMKGNTEEADEAWESGQDIWVAKGWLEAGRSTRRDWRERRVGRAEGAERAERAGRAGGR